MSMVNTALYFNLFVRGSLRAASSFCFLGAVSDPGTKNFKV